MIEWSLHAATISVSVLLMSLCAAIIISLLLIIALMTIAMSIRAASIVRWMLVLSRILPLMLHAIMHSHAISKLRLPLHTTTISISIPVSVLLWSLRVEGMVRSLMRIIAIMTIMRSSSALSCGI